MITFTVLAIHTMFLTFWVWLGAKSRAAQINEKSSVKYVIHGMVIVAAVFFATDHMHNLWHADEIIQNVVEFNEKQKEQQ